MGRGAEGRAPGRLATWGAHCENRVGLLSTGGVKEACRAVRGQGGSEILLLSKQPSLREAFGGNHHIIHCDR